MFKINKNKSTNIKSEVIESDIDSPIIIDGSLYVNGIVEDVEGDTALKVKGNNINAHEIIECESHKNLILNNNEAVDFSQQRDIETSVQDFEGRNLWSTELQAFSTNNGVKSPIEDEKLGYGYYRIRTAFTVDNFERDDIRTYSAQTFNGNGYYTFSLWVRPEDDLYLYLTGSQNSILCPAEIWTQLNITKKVEEETSLRTLQSEGVFSPEYNPWIEYKNYQIIEGTKEHSYQPAPEDLQYAKEYILSQPLQPNKNYAIAVDTDIDDWIGVWLGNDYFAGYLSEYNHLQFSLNEEIDTDKI